MKALHSFTLDPLAAKEVKKIRKGKKSGFVSDSILRNAKYKEYYISKDRQSMPEDMRFYDNLVLLEAFNNKCLELEETKQELAQIRQELKPKRSLISRLFSSNDE